jgi:hypothetical protein
MKHSLRYNNHDIDLPAGQFVIGRAASCQLSLDDPMVSRNHAMLTVAGEDVTLEDLGSRNGVKVNGEKLSGPRKLTAGDQIVIGSQEMLLLRRRELVADTLIQAPTQRVATFGLLGTLADKAFALGRVDEAERLLTEQLAHVLEDAERGLELAPETVERASDYAVKLASSTANGSWVDYIFRLYTALRRPCPGPVVDELYTVLRRVKQVNLGVLRNFIEVLRMQGGALGPAERFLLNRIEGLERLAAAK